MARVKCKTIKADGTPCQSFAVSSAGHCVSHDPDRKASQLAASRRGGEARSAARRAARQWAQIGEQVRDADLPAMLKAAMIAVRSGSLEPAQATAIAALAKSALSLNHDLELEKRIESLEAAAGMDNVPVGIRRIA